MTHEHPHDQKPDQAHDHDDHDTSGEHGHEHDDHNHDDHDTSGEHGHEHDQQGRFAWLWDILPFGHGHSHASPRFDAAMESDARGIRALKISLIGLSITAALQLVIVVISGSAALLADTIHNVSDALTAIPLWIAFVLARRPASRRYTYGYGRAEDLAGVFIVLMIALSAAIAGYESVRKLFNPQPVAYVWWVVGAAIIGFLGNEAVALLRIRVGREIGSAALVADGKHARVDGLTSLAVLFGALGSMAGFPIADPLVGVLITIAIVFILKDTLVTIWQRLMDAVDPQLVDLIEQTATKVAGVQRTDGVRMRWLGHRLEAELHVTVDEDLSTRESHRIAEEVQHALFHTQPQLAVIHVHIEPCGHNGGDAHELTAHHQLQTAHSR